MTKQAPKTLEEALIVIAERDATIVKLQQTIVGLEERLAKLEAKLNQNSQNSSKPPSSDGPLVKLPPKKPPTGRKPGGQPGHKGSHRELLPPERVDEIIDHWPDKCEGCQAGLPRHLRTEVGEAMRHQVTEIPPVKAHVTEHRLHAQYCKCGCTTRAELPDGVTSGCFGVRLQAVLTLFTGCYHVSRRAAAGALSDLFGVQLSLGSVTACEQAMSEALKKPVEQAHQYVQEQEQANADETGWREQRRRAWLWVMATPWVTVFMIHAQRSRAAAKALLGKFEGILITDRWGAYAHWPLRMRQLCWAHLKRDFTFISECAGSTGKAGKKLLAIEQQVFALWHRVRDGTLKRSSFQIYLGPLKKELDALLRRGAKSDNAKAAGMCKELLAVQSAFWTFARVEGIEPTNNHGERTIRPAVLWRKGSFGTHSEGGSRFTERILTVVTTLKQQKRNVLEFLVDAGSAFAEQRTPPSLLPNLSR